MSFDLIPLPLKLAALAGFAFIVGGASWYARGVVSDGDIDAVKLGYQVAITTAAEAKLAAETRATAAEKAKSDSLAAASTTYEEVRKNDKDISDRRIADLNARITSLRVSTRRGPVSSGAVPGAPTCAAGSDGEAVQTLSPTVAGRLARRYADYNEIVDQLNLCQATISIDRQQ